jgi:hypothetical protein
VPSPIIDFYFGEAPNPDGDKLEEITGSWSNHAWEASHTTIQWVFPLKDPSNFNPDAPLLTEEDIAKWNEESMEGAVLRNNLALSFARFVRFLGFEYKDTEVKIADDFSERQKTVWDGFNHNWLRITRCLASLRMLGLQKEADALYKRLQALYESKRFPISEKTFKFWTEAVSGQPFSSSLGG